MFRATVVLLHVSFSYCLASAATIELYRVNGSLLDVDANRVAVQTISRTGFQLTGAKVTIVDIASRSELFEVSSQQVLSSFETIASDEQSAATLHYGFGTSASFAGDKLLVGSPGNQSYCDCSTDPGLEVLGRQGRAFVFDLVAGVTPVELSAPSLSILTQEGLFAAGDSWLYFGHKVAATSSLAFSGGSTYDLSTGARITRVENGNPAFDSIAMSNTRLAVSHTWGQEISIYNLLGDKLRTLNVPATGDAFGQTIALEGNLALVGVPGRHFDPSSPGEALLFDIQTGEKLMTFSARDLGVMSTTGGDGFGRAVAIHGHRILIGAPYDSELSHQSGAAYLFDIQTGNVLEKILPKSREYPRFFGSNVELTNSYALIEDHTFNGTEQILMTTVYGLVPEPSTWTTAVIAVCVCLSIRRRST